MPTFVYVGTYTGEKSKGIYSFDLRPMPQGAMLAPLGVAAETPSPSFLEIDYNRHLLFSVNEVGEFQGKPTARCPRSRSIAGRAN
jgi:6-phosphogluconolactonase (cycloisomerase 2 family)